MVHKPKHKVHSFRGLLADGGQDEISLERQNVNIAYRIVKLDVMVALPGGANQDSVVQVWREKQTSVVFTVDFSDPDLLACGTANQHDDDFYETKAIFDNILFSRNIYITHGDQGVGQSCNYYIEIEEVPVGAATLMQIKLGTARKLISGSMGK